MKTFVRILLITASTLLAGCAYGPSGGKLGQSGLVEVTDATGLPEPGISDAIGQLRSYVVGPQDRLIVDVFGIEEMTAREITVDGAGRISIPLVGTIDAAGKTPEELAAAIIERLRATYMRNPQVSVNVQEMVSQFVTVDGQVVQPGLYPVLGDMTLTSAIASAKGMAEFAKIDDVIVMRTVNGRRYAGVYNMAAIRRGNYPDPRVFANDFVVVGDSVARRRLADLLAALPAITSPLVYVIASNN